MSVHEIAPDTRPLTAQERIRKAVTVLMAAQGIDQAGLAARLG